MARRADEPGHQHSAPDQASQAVESIPVLPLDTARRADGTFEETFLAGLCTALYEIGFLQLTGYGATPEQTGELTAAAARFFALPLDSGCGWTTGCPRTSGGYTRLGHEITAGRADAR
jgi:isopenicillin N synthase-like dioxygenase